MKKSNSQQKCYENAQHVAQNKEIFFADDFPAFCVFVNFFSPFPSLLTVYRLKSFNYLVKCMNAVTFHFFIYQRDQIYLKLCIRLVCKFKEISPLLHKKNFLTFFPKTWLLLQMNKVIIILKIIARETRN